MTNELVTAKINVLEPKGRARSGWISCRIGTNLIFDDYALASYFFAKWESKMFDLFLLAAAVEFCDRTQRRPALGWGRSFELRLPVHDPDLWTQKDVHESLHNALEFLTGDRWQITFIKRREPATRCGPSRSRRRRRELRPDQRRTRWRPAASAAGGCACRAPAGRSARPRSRAARKSSCRRNRCSARKRMAQIKKNRRRVRRARAAAYSQRLD